MKTGLAARCCCSGGSGSLDGAVVVEVDITAQRQCCLDLASEYMYAEG